MSVVALRDLQARGSEGVEHHGGTTYFDANDGEQASSPQ
jgi:hypothetical protein